MATKKTAVKLSFGSTGPAEIEEIPFMEAPCKLFQHTEVGSDYQVSEWGTFIDKEEHYTRFGGVLYKVLCRPVYFMFTEENLNVYTAAVYLQRICDGLGNGNLYLATFTTVANSFSYIQGELDTVLTNYNPIRFMIQDMFGVNTVDDPENKELKKEAISLAKALSDRKSA